MSAILNTVETTTQADYLRQRAAQPNGIIAAVGEPWAPDADGLKIYSIDGMGKTGWYHTHGDVFIPD